MQVGCNVLRPSVAGVKSSLVCIFLRSHSRTRMGGSSHTPLPAHKVFALPAGLGEAEAGAGCHASRGVGPGDTWALWPRV